MKIDYNNICLFNNLDIKTLQVIDENLKKSIHQKGSIIHFEDELCEYVEIIDQGRIHIEQWNAHGDIKIIMDYVKYEIFGLNILFSDSPRYFMNVIAQEDTIIYKLRKEVVQALISSSVSFRNQFIEVISNNSKKIGMKIKSDFRETLRNKIQSYLLIQQANQKTNSIVLPISKTKLAFRLGVERTSLSRELQKMKKDGLIIYDRERVTILT